MKKIFLPLFTLGMMQVSFAQSTQTKTVVTDLLECKGDVFCVDHMRDTCNTRKELINDVFNKVVIENETDINREELKVVAMLKKNGHLEDGTNVGDLKKVECVITVTSNNSNFVFLESMSQKNKGIEACRSIMETNLKTKNVLFQELNESRNVLLQRSCRVYLLELIRK